METLQGIWSNLEVEVKAALIALAGALVGALIRPLFERFLSDSIKSTATLMKEMESRELNPKSRRRLVPSALEQLARMCSRLEAPSSEMESRILADKPTLFRCAANTEMRAGSLGAGVIRPILIRLDATAETNAVGIASAVSELETRLKAIAEAIGASQKLMQVLDIAKDEVQAFAVLIQVPRITIRSRQSAEDLITRLAQCMRFWVPGCRVGVEAYICESVVQLLRSSSDTVAIAPEIDEGEYESAPERTGTTEYVRARDTFDQRLCTGYFFTRYQAADSTKALLVRERMSKLGQHTQRLRNIGSKPLTIAISGPPGSGKTQAGNYLGAFIAAESRALVLDITAVDVFGMIGGSTAWSKRSIRDAFGRAAFQTVEQDPAFHESINLAFMDSWAAVQLQQPFVLYVDDLYVQGTNRPIIAQLRAKAHELGLSFILLDRTRVLAVDPREEVLTFTACLWDREEAIRLVKSSTPVDLHDLLRREFHSGWLAAQERFSSYLLEIIARNLGNVEAQNNINLLREALRPQTDPIARALSLRRANLEVDIAQVRTLLISGTPPHRILELIEGATEMDVLLVLGQISWYSIFEDERRAFEIQDIVKWGLGCVQDANSAQSLVDAGRDAGVFSFAAGDSFDVYTWSNTLVRDGAAGIYLRHKIVTYDTDDDQRRITAEMVRRLHSAGSLDILGLVLDVDMLLKVLTALAASSRHGLDVIERLVASQLLGRLRQDVAQTDRVVYTIRQVASRPGLDEEGIAVLAKALVPLHAFSHTLRVVINQEVGMPNAFGALATGVLAGTESGNAAFLNDLAARGGDRGVGFRMAVRLWHSHHIRCLAEAEISEHHCDEATWAAFSARCRTDELQEHLLWVRDAISQSEEDGSATSEVNRFALIVTRCMLREVLERERSLPQSLDNFLVGWAVACRASTPRLSGELVRWVATSINRDLTLPNELWRVDSTGQYACPTVPRGPDVIPYILLMTQAQDRVTLPWRFELTAVGGTNVLELVGDNLPRGFKPGVDALAGAILGTWDGQAADSGHINVQSFSLIRDRIYWRPMVLLDPESVARRREATSAMHRSRR